MKLFEETQKRLIILVSAVILVCAVLFFALSDKNGSEQKALVKGDKIIVFNGIPVEWGDLVVFELSSSNGGAWEMGALGGIPVVCAYSKDGGTALCNTAPSIEPFKVAVNKIKEGCSITATGGSDIIKIDIAAGEDYYDALRKFALIMKEKGIVSQTAPEWAFDPSWETYGFEIRWNKDTVYKMIPLLQKYGIKTITLDAGWYGTGSEEWTSFNGDYFINPDIIGTDTDMTAFVDKLHQEGFRVKLWWSPGITEDKTKLKKTHPDWLLNKTRLSWATAEESGEYYLNPENKDVIAFHKSLLDRFIGYGADGFKQDDIYQLFHKNKDYIIAYNDLINSDLSYCAVKKNDFVVNTCNCGLTQNFYDFPGQNQLITSDPVGASQVRLRGKYLMALNVNGSAVLGDHVELTQEDSAYDIMRTREFYDAISDADFASSIALGMVYQTKFSIDPGTRYKKWVDIYNKYRFYKMKWVNVPFYNDPVECYLLTNDSAMYFSFFTSKSSVDSFKGDVVLTHLEKGKKYQVTDLLNGTVVKIISADSDRISIPVEFTGCVIFEVKML